MENLRLLFAAPPLSLQLLLDGILIGAIFALAAYGMALVWGVMGLINVAQGELVMLGGYAAYFLYRAGIHPLLGVPVAAILLFVLGWALYRIVIFRVVDKDLFISILATYGLSILLQQLANGLFGANVHTAESGFGTLVLLGGAVTISEIKLVAFAAALLTGAPAEIPGMKPRSARELAIPAVILAFGLLAPVLAPGYQTQMAFLWVMIVFALTWDLLGGQMGYNSFGNVLFFGIGMYACVVVQRDLHLGYYSALFLGMGVGAVLAVAVGAVIGSGLLGLRGHSFASGTLGIGIAAGELASGWDFVGGGGGMVPPLFPGAVGGRETFFYYLSFALAVVTFPVLRFLYAGRFGLAINAIRDDEDKAEAMGLRTTRYKTTAWCVSAFFLGLMGGVVGNLVGFIDPREVAFAGSTFGVWMVLMAILGGKGTLWGPVLGAAIFHVMKELFWTYLLGWQRVALGLLIVVIVVFFPRGILGWARERWPERFGQRVDEPASEAGR